LFLLLTRPEEEPREGELERDGELDRDGEEEDLAPEETLGADRVEEGREVEGLEKPGLLEEDEVRGAEKTDRDGEGEALLRREDDSSRGEGGWVKVQGLSW